MSRWSFEAGTPSGMLRNGYKTSELPPGTAVTISGFHARDQSQNVGMLRQLTTADGKTYGDVRPAGRAGARGDPHGQLDGDRLVTSIIAAGCWCWCCACSCRHRGSWRAAAGREPRPATGRAAPAAEPAPRMADGKPDLSGVWWTGGDVGGRGFDGGRGRGGGAPRGGPAPPTFTGLYTSGRPPAAAEEARATTTTRR